MFKRRFLLIFGMLMMLSVINWIYPQIIKGDYFWWLHKYFRVISYVARRVWCFCKLSSLFVEMLNKILIYCRYFLQEPKKSIPPKECLSGFGTFEQICHTRFVLCTLQILGWVLLGVGLQWGGCQELLNYPPPLCGGFTLKFTSKFLLKSLFVRLQTKMQV